MQIKLLQWIKRFLHLQLIHVRVQLNLVINTLINLGILNTLQLFIREI